MAVVVDSLEVQISAQMEKANRAIDSCVKRLEVLARGIREIGVNQGLSEFIKESQYLSSEMENMGKRVSESMKPISDQTKKVTKDVGQLVSEFQDKFKDLGKGFTFSGTTEQMRKVSDKLFNDLEKAKVDLQRISLFDNVNYSSLEKAAAKVMELQNKYESLQKTLEEGGRSYRENLSRITEQANRGAENLAKETEHFNGLAAGMNYGEGVEGLKNKLADYEGRLKDAIQAAQDLENIGAVKTSSYTDAIAKVEQYRSKINQLKAEIESLQAGNNGELGGDLSGAMQQIRNMGNLISQTFADLKSGEIFRSLSESMKDFVKQSQLASGIKIPTEGYRNLLNDIERTEGELEKLEQKQRDMQAAGMDKESKEWQNVASGIEAAQRRLEQYTAQRYRMEGTGADTEFSEGLANQSWIKSALAVAGEAMASLRQKIGEIGGAVSQAVGNIPIIGRLVKETAYAGQKAFEGLKLAMSGIASAGSGVINVFSKIGAAAKSLASGVKSAVSGFSGLDKSSKGLNVSLAGGFKMLLKYGLGVRSVYTLINKLRRAIVDGFKNLATYSNEVNTSLSMLKSSLNTFKNASAAALSPLLNAIAPALNTIIQLCIRATNAINQFLSALFGKGTWIKAKDQALNFAKGVEKAGKAAQKGVRVFDELKVISSDSGGGDNDGMNPADMFETVPIDDKFKDWADRLKQMWANADFTELGSAFGDWLKNALDNIDWDGIKEKAAKLGSSFATFLNGVFETEGLGYSIGTTLAEGINTGFEFLNEFVHDLHWDSLGKFVAETLNGLFQNLDWDLIKDTFFAGAKGLADAINSFDEFLDWGATATTISNAFNTLVGTIRIFVGNVDWRALGADIGKTISDAWTGIDWAEAGATVGESFIAFFDFISSAIENVDWQGIAQTVEDFITGIDWGGVADSFFEALGAAFGGLSAVLGKLLYDAIDGTKKYFQGKIEEVGGNIPKGIFKGITDGLVNIGNWVLEHIFEPFIKGFKNAFGIHSPSTVMQEQGGFIIQGLLDGITSLTDKVTETWESMKNTAIETWETVSSDLSEKWEALKSDASTKFDEIKTNVSEAWENLKSDTSDKWSAIRSDLSDIWSQTKDNASDAFGDIKDSIMNAWNELKENTSMVWDQIKNVIKNPINSILGFINGLTSGIENGINGMINALNGVNINIPDWIPSIGGKTLGFNIPNISIPQVPMLATGAVFRGGNPYMAIVNDQPRGQTNIEAPLKTIKQALREELEKFSANVQLAPSWDIGEFQPAPPPEWDFDAQRQRAYQVAEEHMRRQESAYDSAGNIGGLKEQEIYNIMYNAFTAALTNNRLLREQNEILGDIRQKPTIDSDGLYKDFVRKSLERGGNSHGGNMSRLAVAQELYR